MSLGKKLQVRLTEKQMNGVQKIAIYLNTDVSSVIRAAIDDAIETLNRWTGIEIDVEESGGSGKDEKTS